MNAQDQKDAKNIYLIKQKLEKRIEQLCIDDCGFDSATRKLALGRCREAVTDCQGYLERVGYTSEKIS